MFLLYWKYCKLVRFDFNPTAPTFCRVIFLFYICFTCILDRFDYFKIYLLKNQWVVIKEMYSKRNFAFSYSRNYFFLLY